MVGKLCLIVCTCMCLPLISLSLSHFMSLSCSVVCVCVLVSLTKTVNRLGILIWNANNKHQMRRHRKHRQENAVKTFKLTSPLQCALCVCVAFIKWSHKWAKGSHKYRRRDTHTLKQAQHVHKDKDHNVPINRKSLRVFFFSLYTRPPEKETETAVEPSENNIRQPPRPHTHTRTHLLTNTHMEILR